MKKAILIVTDSVFLKREKRNRFCFDIRYVDRFSFIRKLETKNCVSISTIGDVALNNFDNGFIVVFNPKGNLVLSYESKEQGQARIYTEETYLLSKEAIDYLGKHFKQVDTSKLDEYVEVER